MTQMKISYVDVLVRVKVAHDDDIDPADVVCSSAYGFAYEDAGAEILTDEMKEAITVGECSPESGALLRSDGGTGRNATILHDPPVD
jgi:hypothetical protein